MAHKIPVYATIGAGSKIIHNRYGRGVVHRIFAHDGQAAVKFDDDAGVPRRVRLRDLERQPADMPACHSDPQPLYRLVWPLDAVAGNGEAR
jgi:hypothetical protein